METETRAKVRAVAGAFLVALFGFALGFVVLVVLANLVFAAGVTLGGPTQLFLSLVSLQGIAFPVTAFVYLRVRDLPLSFVNVRRPTLREVGYAVAGWLLVFVLAYALGIIISALDAQPASNQAAEVALEHPEVIPYLIPFIFLLNAPGEELLFRGVIQGSLRERFGPVAAIVLATAMFAPFHIVALLGSLQAMLLTIALLFVPGLVFGALYEYTDNLVVPSLTHGLHNATIFLLIYVVATAGPDGSGTTSLFGLLGVVP